MVKLIDQYGRAITRGEVHRARVKALVGGNSSSPFDAADYNSPEMAGWNPWLGSPDVETNPYRDRAVARIRDLVRNDGWAAGAVTRITDATVGADFRLSARPDYRALARKYGPAFDAVWAKEYADAREASWRAWAYDPGRWCDTTRRWTVPQIIRLAFRHYLVEGEALAVLPWRPERVGYGRARYATTVQLVDPDRLSNPQLRPDSLTMRGGVEIDADGAPIAYHIRQAHQQDWFAAGQSVTWDRIPRETDWGRPMVVHHFDPERAGQHRPVGGIFTPVLARLRMLAQYDRVELQAAIVNAIFGAYIESPFDPDDVQKGLAGDDELSAYQQMRAEFHQDRRLMAGNVRLATLFPGEKISTISASRPVSAFDAFEGAVLRNFAAAIGVSYETVAGDYRGSTYSSARQALLIEWRTVTRRRLDFAAGFCSIIADAQHEEAFELGELPLPRNAPDYAEARAEYNRCEWIGPGRGWVDPKAEVEGARLRIASGLSTLEHEAAENAGADLEELLDQRAYEEQMVRERGLTLDLQVGGSKPANAEERGAGQPAEAR
ncbi:MAG: phage portal protein [Microbispora sp.]|nr:phage portal protein [Microbispora sp.]